VLVAGDRQLGSGALSGDQRSGEFLFLLAGNVVGDAAFDRLLGPLTPLAANRIDPVIEPDGRRAAGLGVLHEVDEEVVADEPGLWFGHALDPPLLDNLVFDESGGQETRVGEDTELPPGQQGVEITSPPLSISTGIYDGDVYLESPDERAQPHIVALYGDQNECPGVATLVAGLSVKPEAEARAQGRVRGAVGRTVQVGGALESGAGLAHGVGAAVVDVGGRVQADAE
jgi:hypothetical protein